MTQEAYCPRCEDYRPVREEQRKETHSVRGEDIEVDLAVKLCEQCGEILFDEERDGALLDKVYAEYRRRAGLQTSAEIKEVRLRYGLSQRSFATLLGMSQATVNRYEAGGLQDQAHDALIRAYANPETMRDLVEHRGRLLSDRQRAELLNRLKGEIGRRLATLPREMTFGEKPSIWTGFRLFSYERYAATVAWLCERLHQVVTTKMNKLLFYADFRHFGSTSSSITGAAYLRMQFGPVPEHYDWLVAMLEEDGYVVSQEVVYSNDCVGTEFVPGPRASELKDVLEPIVVETLAEVCSRLGHMTAREVSERSHRERAWTETQDRERISYQNASNLSGLAAA